MATVKVIELVGESTESWEDAARSAAKSAAHSISDMVGIEVVGWTGKMDDSGNITLYHANVKVAFKVDESR